MCDSLIPSALAERLGESRWNEEIGVMFATNHNLQRALVHCQDACDGDDVSKCKACLNGVKDMPVDPFVVECFACAADAGDADADADDYEERSRVFHKCATVPAASVVSKEAVQDYYIRNKRSILGTTCDSNDDDPTDTSLTQAAFWLSVAALAIAIILLIVGIVMVSIGGSKHKKHNSAYTQAPTSYMFEGGGNANVIRPNFSAAVSQKSVDDVIDEAMARHRPKSSSSATSEYFG